MNTVGELKKAIADLPDDMPVVVEGEVGFKAETDDTFVFQKVDGHAGVPERKPVVVLYIEADPS